MIYLGMILGLFGVFLIFSGNLNVMLNHNYLIGIAGLLVSMAGWTFGTLYSKHKKLSVNPLMGAAVQMIIAGTIVTLIAVSLGEFSFIKFTQNGLIAFLYLVIVGSILSYPAYIYAVIHLPVSLVSTYAYVNPLIALFLGWLVLSEEISSSIIVAAVVIFIGVTLVKKGSA
jgi:drug/metabolite transporter (DMT)-like permease